MVLMDVAVVLVDVAVDVDVGAANDLSTDGG